jgi:hypothetical protein
MKTIKVGFVDQIRDKVLVVTESSPRTSRVELDTLNLVTYFGKFSEIFSKTINYHICNFDRTIFRNSLENPEISIPDQLISGGAGVVC